MVRVGRPKNVIGRRIQALIDKRAQRHTFLIAGSFALSLLHFGNLMWHIPGALVDNPFIHNGVIGCAVNGTGLKAHLFQQTMLISQLPVWAETSTKGLPLSLRVRKCSRHARANAVRLALQCASYVPFLPERARYCATYRVAQFYVVWRHIGQGGCHIGICQFVFTREAAKCMHGNAGEFCAERESKSFENPDNDSASAACK